MKNLKKGLLSALLAICVLLTAAAGNMASAAGPEVMAAVLASALKSNTVGQSLHVNAYNGANTIRAEGADVLSGGSNPVSAVGVKPLGLNAVGAELSLGTAVRQDWSAALPANYQLSLRVEQSTAGYKGIMVYVKLPDTELQDNQLWFRIYNNSGTGTSYPIVAGGKPVYLLDRSTREWSTSTVGIVAGTATGITLPDAFEGYIYVPFTTFSVAIENIPYIYNFTYILKNWGGADGNFNIGPFFFAGNDLRTGDLAQIDGEVTGKGETVVRSLFSGPSSILELSEGGLLKDAAAGDSIHGAVNTANPIQVEGAATTGGQLTAVAEQIPGLRGVSARLDMTAAVDLDWSSGLTTVTQLGLTVEENVSGVTGVVFYLKLPEIGESNVLCIQFRDATAGAGLQYPRLAVSKPVYILNAGETQWAAQTTAALGSYGKIVLPDGFEGYINIPFSSLNLSIAYMNKMQFFIRAFGGENGSAHIGPFYFTDTNVSIASDTDYAWIDEELDRDNSTPVYRSLFSGLRINSYLPDIKSHLLKIAPYDSKYDLNTDTYVDVVDLMEAIRYELN